VSTSRTVLTQHRLIIISVLFSLALSSSAFGNFITNGDELAAKGVDFTWSEVGAKSLKIILEHRNENGGWQRLNLGSGFLISPGGLFITAYHVTKFCLESYKGNSGLSVSVDCSTARDGIRYKALNGDREFEIQIISYLKETDSTQGKDIHTPDEIIKQRDFVVGKLKSPATATFSYWPLRDFDESTFDMNEPRADFQLTPLMPPKRVFVVGFPQDRDFVISEGFLNLTEKKRRGYFAANYKLYTTAYLESQGIAPDTKWGMRIENHMSGGAVIDSSGQVIGLVVNGDRGTAGVLSIENVLSTFFSRLRSSKDYPAVILNPTAIPLYLRDGS